eukprot:TRINITY_DN23050_c0_g1_i1.p4 TRINITY_DN23050_c0_g1~~TRINITY_DN23050_c0_g1_i1.p4  ORF type:complete len:104 (-),score=26.16 TRINITY_DN23050_c0_g1_i1:407-718(-)
MTWKTAKRDHRRSLASSAGKNPWRAINQLIGPPRSRKQGPRKEDKMNEQEHQDVADALAADYQQVCSVVSQQTGPEVEFEISQPAIYPEIFIQNFVMPFTSPI